MGIKFTNNAVSTLASAITDVATTLTVMAGDGAKFPALGGGDYFRATIVSAGSMEIVKVTARSTDTFTITRAEEGTTAAAFASGAAISLYTTAQDLYDLASERQAPITAVGILKGAGAGSVSAAVAGTDYVAPYGSQTANFFFAAPNGSAGTPSFRAIAVADVPTLNQATTGSAAKWTTPRLLAGNSVDGSVDKPFANKFIVQGTADAGLSGAQFMGAQSTGLVKNITGTGVLTIATMGLDYMQPQAVTGIVKSNIQTWSAAVAGTDYVSPSGTETVSNKTLTNATIYATTITATSVSASMNGQGSNGPGALGINCNDSGFATAVWGSANTYFCVSKGGAENALYFSGNIKAPGYDVAAATLHSTGNANINGEAIIGGSAWITGGGSFDAAVTASKLGVNIGSVPVPAPFTFYNNGMAWSQSYSVPPPGYFGLNLYYGSGSWRFVEANGWGSAFSIDSGGGVHITSTPAASTGAGAATASLDRIYIDAAGVMTVGDVVTHRGNDSGVVYLGNTKGHYFYFDGGKFQIFGGATVTASPLGVVCSATPIAPLDVQVTPNVHFIANTDTLGEVQLGAMTDGGASWRYLGLYGNPYVYPTVDNACHFGSGSNRWNTIYCVNGTINTSDERLKTDIQDSTLGLDFVEALRPVSYKWLVGQNIVTRVEDGVEVVPPYTTIDGVEMPESTKPKYKDVVTPVPGVRPHWGMIAQDVHSAMKAKGVADFGGFVMEDPLDANSTQSLRYDEFIAPMIKAIQELSEKVKVLEAQLAAK